MPKVAPFQDSFSVGELGPLTKGRASTDIYKKALSTCLNYLPTPQGPVIRRPGTRHVALLGSTSKPARLQTVRFNGQDFILAFENLKFSVFKDGALVLTGGSPYSVVTTYDGDDVPDLNFVQLPDSVYIFHKDYRPQKLVKGSTDTSWTLSDLVLWDGPYGEFSSETTGLNANLFSFLDKYGAVPIFVSEAGSTTRKTARLKITDSGATHKINSIDASGSASTAGINGGAGFQSTDVGRKIRIRVQDAGSHNYYTVFKIATVVSTTEVTYLAPASGGTFSSQVGVSGNIYEVWWLELYSTTTGWPAGGVLHDSRLAIFGKVSGFENRVDLSEVGEYNQFSPTNQFDGTANAYVGSVVDSNAMALVFPQKDEVKWLSSEEKGLFVGTAVREIAIYPPDGSALTVSNILARTVTRYGGEEKPPLNIGESTLFLQLGKKKLRELNFNFSVEAYQAPDRTILSNHILGNGATAMAFQNTPSPYGWFVKADGTLAVMNYERDGNDVSIGWARAELGAPKNTFEGITNAVVESVAVAMAPDGLRQELWLCVKRQIGNPFGGGYNIKRSIEYMTKIFEDTDSVKDAFFVDYGYKYDAPKDIQSAAITLGTATLYCPSHGFSVSDEVEISGTRLGLAVTGKYTITAIVDADNFSVLDDVSGNSFNVPWSDWEVRKYVDTISSGISHLNGLTVDVLADGSVRSQVAVSGGTITVSGPKFIKAVVGLGYNSDAQILPIDAGSANGTAYGKTRRTNRVGLLFHRTGGFKIGPDFDSLDPVYFRDAGDPTDAAVPLFTGIKSLEISCDYDFENKVCWRQSNPLPGTVLAYFPQMETQDR